MPQPPRSLREDVHIHASIEDVYARLDAVAGEWWPPAFSAVAAADGTLEFSLGLPGRRERASLIRTAEERPRFLEYTANGGGNPVHRLAWAIERESATEVHVSVELVYEPAGGAFGWMLEESAQRPARTQALRDMLWRLKLLSEGQR